MSRREETPEVARTSEGRMEMAGLNLRLMRWDTALGRSDSC
jgi:hypothetical protein